MSKQEILEALQLAKKVYMEGIQDARDLCTRNSKFDIYAPSLIDKDIHKGFCQYFQENYSGQHKEIIKELQKDILDIKSCDIVDYWYPIPLGVTKPADISNYTLYPRLEHLNRTIARLEAELQPQTTRKA